VDGIVLIGMKRDARRLMVMMKRRWREGKEGRKDKAIQTNNPTFGEEEEALYLLE
jgi:hypothetical protein